ncbi:hypothetical protein Pint_11430 [Pistacia integerrima]|uniref:Uncharacterized protein n=1 Tax=Pistacia integerrima TaxID=434235 RepID=A0ACC0XJG0_9ROSI|nr:hypothetical protein Pint_11430 [Pistacia integerrima]
MLHLYCNLHHPSPPLLLPLQKQFFPTPSPIDQVKFNLNEGFVKITKISIAVNCKKSERSSGEGSSGEKWVHEGFIIESLPNGMFRVCLDNEDLILGYISGKIRQNFVRVLPGDRVKLK